MLIKSDNPTTSASPACVQCGVKEKRLLHQVRHRGVFRRLCTTCVLRLHPQSFCPTCYQVYPPPPPNDAVLSCFKCYSSTHSHCVPSPAPSPYICPLCTNPTAPIFILKTINKEESTGEEGKGVECRVMDVDSAKKLLAAAKISSASMNKAAVAARVEAEKRAKEAAFARKKAKEALEHVSYMVVREKLRKKEVPGSNGFAQVKSENHVNVVNNGSSRNGILSSIAAGSSSVVVEEEEKISADRVENSNQVLEALNAVELRENENKNGIESNDDCVSMMDVDESGSVEIEKNVGGIIDHVMENGSSENLVIEEDVENDEVVQEDLEEDNTGGENQANGTPQ